MRLAAAFVSSLWLVACSASSVDPAPSSVPLPSSAVVVDDDVKGPKKLKGVPPGHYPPPGQCRLWHEGRPPGHQPRPQSCESLVGRVPEGAFVLYNDDAWDADYDWRGHAARHAGSVPTAILRVFGGSQP